MDAISRTKIGLTKIRNKNLMIKRKSFGLMALVKPKICMNFVKLAQVDPAQARVIVAVLLRITTAIA